jgi:putative YhbY family RNA-binding protein
MRTLTPAERRAFRAKAHPLHPVVAIGQHGLTPAVLHEIDVNLLAHELIKIRVFSDERGERETLLARICADLDAAPVQHLGKILTIWRPAPPPEPEPAVRRPERRDRTKKTDGGTTGTRKASPSPRAGAATAAKRAPRRGRSVIEGLPSATRKTRGSASGPGKRPASKRPPPPHGKSASSRVGASGARRRRKARA